jgi:hypothetical protein
MIQLSRLLQLTAGMAALAISGQVLANPCPPGDPPTNCAPPVGTAVFDLATVNGGLIPHSYTEYSVNFMALGSTTDLAFAIREDPAFFSLDDVSVTALGGGPNLVSDGDFSNATLSPWTYDNNYGVNDANGELLSGCGTSGGNCFYDGAVQAYDGIDQNISTVAGQQYTLSFWLTDNSGQTTAQQLSTNGDVSNPGGNGIDVLAYAGVGIPVEGGPPPTTGVAPEIDPASAMSALTLLLGGLTVLRGRKSTTKA